MANGQIQFKTYGLMLAVGQQYRLQKRNFKTHLPLPVQRRRARKSAARRPGPTWRSFCVKQHHPRDERCSERSSW
ncbi:hypothetical protein RISK_004759 [Rhodopirellula islandica]|uniref:Uncharacterized protein n=1 Tax=Rhodopirellula islandica TaxID=595434 RepID=A0A0J1B9Q3_RHOIS|nr:hypothetical protein RISK_004759 [Rhodopirellula islandica]